jgi:hypothetical protein
MLGVGLAFDTFAFTFFRIGCDPLGFACSVCARETAYSLLPMYWYS